MTEVRCTVDESARPSLENLRHARRAMDAQYLVARVEGSAVGCAMSTVFPGTRGEPFLWWDASVLPSHRSRGIGEELLRRVSARGHELGKQGLHWR